MFHTFRHANLDFDRMVRASEATPRPPRPLGGIGAAQLGTVFYVAPWRPWGDLEMASKWPRWGLGKTAIFVRETVFYDVLVASKTRFGDTPLFRRYLKVSPYVINNDNR